MVDRIIIIPNVLVEDRKILKITNHVEANAFNGKALNSELFEYTMRTMMYKLGLIANRYPEEPTLLSLAMRSCPTPNSQLMDDEWDELYDEQYETIKYACEELENHVNSQVMAAMSEIDAVPSPFRRVEFYYGVPDANAITLLLTNRSVCDEDFSSYHYR